MSGAADALGFVPSKTDADLLDRLADDWCGDDSEDAMLAMLEEAVYDGVCPGICRTCGYTTEVEPDSASGWCEDCEAQTVVSALRLAGVV